MTGDHTTTPQQDFGAFLRTRREGRSVTLDEIARITKIPSRSLQRLEAGTFDGLPADVFVRGFVKSYASCVGLDPEDALQRYIDARTPPKPERGERTASRVDLLPRGPVREPQSSTAPGEDTAMARAGAMARSVVAPLFGSFVDRSETEGSRKGTVTLAVIILVIVATLTMSYLLRRPSHSGDGVTRADTQQKLLA